jgi:L-alanine-DL-glutamate epimerase-like enolase superfamily enzyme
LPHIASVNTKVVEASIRGVFRIAYSAAATTRSVFVEIMLDDGTRGWGEASPSRRVTWENIEAVRAYVEAVAPRLKGLSLPRELGKALRAVHSGGPGFSSARAGLESAILDASARVLGEPVYTLLGGAVHDHLVTDYTVSIPGEDVLKEIRSGEGPLRDAFIESIRYLVGLRSDKPGNAPIPLPDISGFSVLKVKLGTGDPDLDVMLAETVYYAAEGRARIRVDANQAWTRKQAIRVIRRLEDLMGSALELVEQPVPANRLEDLRAVREAVETPVAADESARSPAEAALVAKMGAADVVNIKIAKAGGPLQGAKIASLLEAHGLEAMWGCMAETGLGIAQALHAALASEATRYVDLDSPLFLVKDPVRNPPRYEKAEEGIVLRHSGGPGLGPEPLE